MPRSVCVSNRNSRQIVKSNEFDYHPSFGYWSYFSSDGTGPAPVLSEEDQSSLRISDPSIHAGSGQLGPGPAVFIQGDDQGRSGLVPVVLARISGQACRSCGLPDRLGDSDPGDGRDDPAGGVEAEGISPGSEDLKQGLQALVGPVRFRMFPIFMHRDIHDSQPERWKPHKTSPPVSGRLR